MVLKNSIFIGGFKHVGKTTVGQMFAKQLNLPFIDLDQKLEEQHGCCVRSLFDDKNPDLFRHKELDALQKLDLHVQQIVALGGGTLNNEKNRQFIQNTGSILVLNAPFEIVFERIMKHSPNYSLIDKNNPKNSLKDLYDQRKKELEKVGYPMFDAMSLTLLQEMEEYVRKHLWKNF